MAFDFRSQKQKASCNQTMLITNLVPGTCTFLVLKVKVRSNYTNEMNIIMIDLNFIN